MCIYFSPQVFHLSGLLCSVSGEHPVFSQHRSLLRQFIFFKYQSPFSCSCISAYRALSPISSEALWVLQEGCPPHPCLGAPACTSFSFCSSLIWLWASLTSSWLSAGEVWTFPLPSSHLNFFFFFNLCYSALLC